jgi:hypothetical protein
MFVSFEYGENAAQPGAQANVPAKGAARVAAVDHSRFGILEVLAVGGL